MKSSKLFTLSAFIGLSFLISSFNVGSKVNAEIEDSKIFTIIYVDHSRPGLSEGLSDLLFDIADSLPSNFLLYLSNGDEPAFTKKTSEIKNKLKNLSEGHSMFPDFIKDKNNMFKEIRTEKLNQYQKIRIYYFFTENYLEDLLKYNAAHFIKLFPTELLLLNGLENTEAEVIIYYTPNPDSKLDTYLKGIDTRLDFYNTDKYKKNIKYTISKK